MNADRSYRGKCPFGFQLIGAASAQGFADNCPAPVPFFVGRHWQFKVNKPVAFSRNPRTLAEHLVKRRLELGLLQRQAAEQMGATLFSLIHWEREHHQPALKFWPAILAFLGYDPLGTPVSLGEHLWAERRSRGISQARMARELSFDPSTLKRIEADAYQRIDGRVRGAYFGLLSRYGLSVGEVRLSRKKKASTVCGGLKQDQAD